MNLNKVFLIGRLTQNPETRTLPSGQTVVSFGLATNRIWTDQTGQKQEMTEFHNIVVFGKLADICSQYLTKGRLVLIEGRIQTRSWQTQDGQKRYRTEIIAENMQMGPRIQTASTSSTPEENSTPNTPNNPEKINLSQEEIPVIDVEQETVNPLEVSPNEEANKENSFTESEDKGRVEVKNIPF